MLSSAAITYPFKHRGWCSKPMLLNWGQLCLPRGHLAMSGDIYRCHNWGRGCYWHQMGRGQGCCETSYYALDSPTVRDLSNSNYQGPRFRSSARNQWLSKRFTGELIKMQIPGLLSPRSPSSQRFPWAPGWLWCPLPVGHTQGHLTGEEKWEHQGWMGIAPRHSPNVSGSASGSVSGRKKEKKKLTLVKRLSLSLSLSQALNCREHSKTNLSANDN